LGALFILFNGVRDLPRHERLWILFKDTLAGLSAKIDLLAAKLRTGMISLLAQVASAGCGIFDGAFGLGE
jgi:hypothetical protein